MDVDNPNTPTSRDPRLVSRNRPAPARTASLDTGISGSPNGPKFGVRPPNKTPPSDRQDGATGDQFVRALSELIKAAVDTATREVGKEKLLKRKDTTEGLLRKAKAAPSFPSTTAFFQQARNDEDSELTRMDETITKHQSHYRQLENCLTTKWVPLLLRNNSDSDEKINKLQDEIRALKKRVGDSAGESDASREKFQSLETKIKILQDRVVLLEKTSGNHTASINAQMRHEKEIKERVDKLSSDFAQFPSQGTVPTHFSSEVDELKRITMTLDAKLSSLQKAQEEYSGSLERVNKSMDAQQKRLDASNDTGNAFQQKFKEIHERLVPIEMVKAAPPEAPATVPIDASNIELRLKNVESNLSKVPRPDSSLQSRVQNLAEKVDQLQNLQAMKDELHFAEMEEIKKAAVDKAEIQSLKDSFSRIAEETRMISQENPTAAVDKAEIQSLKDSYSRLAEEVRRISQLEPAAAVDKAEIQSLKDSYGRLAEEIQRMSQWNPAAALQQINTVDLKINTVDVSLKNANRLLESVRVGLHSLETRYNHLSTEMVVKNMVVAMQEMYPSAGQLTEQITSLENQAEKEISCLKKTIEQLVQAQNSQKTMLGQQSAEGTHLRETIGKVALQVSALTEQLEGARALPDKLQQLHTNFNSLAEQYQEHVSEIKEYTKSKEAADGQNRIELYESYRELKDQVQNLSSHTKDLQSLDDRFRRFKESVSADHQDLLEQLDALKNSLESQQPESVTQSPKREESPAGSDDVTSLPNYAEIAEANPALALREKKKRKKRPRPSTISDDENERSSGARNESPRTFSSPAHALDNEGASPSESKRKSKKRKKRRLITEGPITID
ncbi:uncharacterized protein CDV56_105949 [Aspergillus thermomutatus]|uniref:Paramyosin n=1 Tax=Aspergillus thermomutatus TaxID=41047 RepID=A0A397HRM5_ASPTH|nr:uncharacterized protein CDV56_105949 [Aspergillus thermomutatus]RHZ65652.1 hypothetical protein CDV56_105949 [Aspergillus thermomutatus]